MDSRNHLTSLLFDRNSDEEEGADHHEEDMHDDLLEEDQCDHHQYMQHVAGRPPISDTFLKVRGEKTERHFHAQNQSKLKFAEAIGPSVEFSQSELSHSHLGKDKSPAKASPAHFEDELRKRDARIEYLQRELDRKIEMEKSVDRVLGLQLGSLQRQHQSSNHQVRELEAQIRGYKKKIEQLEESITNLQTELKVRSDRERQLQQQLSKETDEVSDLMEVITSKDQLFEEMKKELQNAAEKISRLEEDDKSLRRQYLEMKNQFETWNIEERNTNYLNGDRPNRRLEEVASKRSLTNIYDRNGTELKKQYSTKTLIEDTPVRLRDERLRMELEEAKKKLAHFEQGFLETKRQSERLQALTEEMERVGANQKAEIDKLRADLKNRENYISEISKTLEREKRGGRDRMDKELIAANQLNNELRDTLSEYERRFRTQNEKLLDQESRLKDLLQEITKKSLAIQEDQKLITEQRGLLDLESKKLIEANKQIKVLSGQLKEIREKSRSLERAVEESSKGKKEQDRIEQLKKDVIRLEKEAEERESNLKQLKKRLQEANKKAAMGRSRITDLEEQLNSAKAEIGMEKQSQKKLLSSINELKKKAAETETLNSKLKIVEAQLRSEKERSQQNSRQVKDEFDLNDRLEVLQEILKGKEREVEELQSLLRQQEQHHHNDRSSYKGEGYSQQQSHVNEQVNQLLCQLEERDMAVEQLRRQLEFKEKSLQFIHSKLMKVEREKLEMEAEAKIFQSNLYESTDSQYLSENEMDSYNTKLTYRRDKLEHFEQKLRSLQDVNRQLEQKNKQLEERLREEVAEKKKSTASLHQNNPSKQSLPTTHSTEMVRESCSNKIEVLVLKNRVKELTEMLNKVYNESNSKKLPPESLSPHQTLEFLLETMRRVNRSSEMIRLLGKSSQFIQLMRHIDRRREEVNHTRRLYA